MPALLAQRFANGLAQTDPRVFDGVMLIDVQIAHGLQLQIDRRMFGEQRQHVIEEAHAGRDIRRARSVQLQFELDVGLGGFALNAGGSGHFCRGQELGYRGQGTGDRGGQWGSRAVGQ